MENFKNELIVKEFFYFIIATIIGSIFYFLLQLYLSNKVYVVFISIIFGLIFYIIILYFQFWKKRNLLGIQKIFIKFNDSPSPFDIISKAKTEVIFLGISGRTFFESEEISELIKKKLRQEISFKFLILDPESKYLELKATEEGEEPEAWRHDINATIIRFKKLNEESKTGRFLVKKYNCLPIWRAVIIDHKIGIFSFYPHGDRAKKNIVFSIINKDYSIYEPINTWIRFIWENLSVPIDD